MTPTEISDHAKKIAEDYGGFPADGEEFFEIVEISIQHGINLAVESKDLEIERLKVILLEAQQLNVRLDSHLTEASAKLERYTVTISSAHVDCETWRKHALTLEESCNRSQAEIERLKAENLNLIKKINDLNGWRRDNFPV